MDSLDPIVGNWREVGTTGLILSAILAILRKPSILKQVVIVIGSQLRLNKIILDKDLEIRELKGQLKRAEADVLGERSSKESAIRRNEELSILLDQTIKVQEKIKEAKEKGVIQITTPPLSEDETQSSGSGISLPRRDPPMAVIHRSD